MIPVTIKVVAASAKQDAYRKFFKDKLEEFGVSSPSELNAEQKSEFFGAIKAGWSKHKATASPYQKYFQGKLKEFGVKSPAELPEDQRDDFFESVDQGWDAGENETD